MKRRTKPPALLTLDAVISRLENGNRKLPELGKHAARMQKGYNGERKLDYHTSSLPEAFTVLNDVTLRIFEKQVQIDCLIVSEFGMYVVEVKSYEGTVTFHTALKQCVQDTGEKLQGYKYPISQVETIHFHLLRFLEQYRLVGLPIYYFIAFSEQSTIIQVEGDEEAVSKAVC